MTLISTGSTFTPSFSSHLIASLISAREPSNSRQTTPISSVTLACRTLVITLNLWPSSQITAVVIRRGGYISHSRVFCSCELVVGRLADCPLDFLAPIIKLSSRQRWLV